MGKRQQQQEQQRFHGDFMSQQGLITMTNHHTTAAPAEQIMATMPPLPLPTATTCTPTNSTSMPPRQLSGSREAMKPLYDRLLEHSFPDSTSAVEFCRNACAEHGFTVKQEASANKHIYVYCSREGLPDSVRKPRSSPQRKRPSKRCDCRWRVVLSETEPNSWEFRRSLNPNAAEHNHEMMSPGEMVQNWPNEVNEFIIGLARRRMQTHEIRDMVKQQFPSIAWNERRFYNRLTEERKRIRQRDVMDRSQRLLTVSARVCSLVAANEDWSTCVESEFERLLTHYCRLARTDGEGLVNFNTELMKIFEDHRTDDGDTMGNSSSVSSSWSSDDASQSDVDNTNNSNSNNQEQTQQPEPKRRKSMASTMSNFSSQQPPVRQQQETLQQMLQSQQQVDANILPKGTQTVHVPGYTLFVRLQSQRRSSERSSSIQRSGRRNNAPVSTTEQLDVNPFSTSFPLASPEASSSSSSASTTLLHHHQYGFQQQRSSTIPQQPRSISDVIPPQQIPDHHGGTFVTATTMQQSHLNNNGPTFTPAAYTAPLSGTAGFSSPSSELSFAFDNPAPSSWEDHHQRQHPAQSQQMMNSSHQYDPMVMNAKQQAVLFGYISSDGHHHHHHHQQVQQQRSVPLNNSLRHSLPVQMDNSPDTVNG